MTGSFFSTKTKGIGGQIKRRYTDFIVEEMQTNGKLCKVQRFIEDGTHHSDPVEAPKNPKEKEQLHVDLEKINKDLNFSIKNITRFLQCSKKRVGYAGLKDKRGVTCQRISLFKPNLERLHEFHSMGLQMRNPEWQDERIEIGMLKGNQFMITVRDIALEKKEVEKRVKTCIKEMDKGIANYFGEQRFGGIRKVTHLVGKEFVKGHAKEAVMLYLTHFNEREEEEVKNARKALGKTNDFSEASKTFPNKYRYERAIIHHLCRFPNDFVGAFANLPKHMRYLFTHAYQSYLFNKVIDERITQGFGIGKIEGDILIEGMPAIPLFGFESELAKGKAGEIEKKVLEKENVSLEEFKVKQMPELSSKGARKSMVLVPQNLKLLKIEEDEFFEEKVAATVSFYLDKGNYATTVMREFMKVEEN